MASIFARASAVSFSLSDVVGRLLVLPNGRLRSFPVSPLTLLLIGRSLVGVDVWSDARLELARTGGSSTKGAACLREVRTDFRDSFGDGRENEGEARGSELELVRMLEKAIGSEDLLVLFCVLGLARYECIEAARSPLGILGGPSVWLSPAPVFRFVLGVILVSPPVLARETVRLSSSDSRDVNVTQREWVIGFGIECCLESDVCYYRSWVRWAFPNNEMILGSNKGIVSIVLLCEITNTTVGRPT